MGLFDRRAGKGAPFDWLVVGLGNPGPKYQRTRHNVGEECVRLLAERHDTHLKAGRDNSLIGETRFGQGADVPRVALAFPLTFMNKSGQAVSALVGVFVGAVVGIFDHGSGFLVHEWGSEVVV